METIIGFAAGYLAGTRDGRAGLERLKTSVEAIAKSPQARKMAAEAISVAGMIAGRGSARGLGATASAVADIVMRRVTDTAIARRQNK